jgi:hypothetical protein
MNGVCGTASGTTSGNVQERGGVIPGTNSPIRRAGTGTGIGSLSGVGVGSISGCSVPTQGPDYIRSRSQGGKKLQKCLSTASYGEESSFSRIQMATPPLSHNLLMTRQYCSFGSTTSLTKSNYYLLLLST